VGGGRDAEKGNKRRRGEGEGQGERKYKQALAPHRPDDDVRPMPSNSVRIRLPAPDIGTRGCIVSIVSIVSIVRVIPLPLRDLLPHNLPSHNNIFLPLKQQQQQQQQHPYFTCTAMATATPPRPQLPSSLRRKLFATTAPREDCGGWDVYRGERRVWNWGWEEEEEKEEEESAWWYWWQQHGPDPAEPDPDPAERTLYGNPTTF